MAGKKVKGRKRHIAVDIMGFILAVVVHAANIHDTTAGCLPASEAFDKYPTIERFSADAGYRGTFVEWVGYEFDGVGVDISERIKPKFEILPKRWIVERTFAWLGNYRRLSKDYEKTTDSAENMVYIASLHSMLKRF
jgi:putative transposase